MATARSLAKKRVPVAAVPVDLAEPCENVAREGLENIANGPMWIVSTPGNLEQVQRVAQLENRADVIRANSIRPREETAEQALQAKALAGN